jgi:hypothetical protein
MSGPVSCHLPVDASLHSFNSLDYGFGAGESPFLAGSADATCGVAAVRAVSQYLNLEPMRAGVSFADTPGQLAQPAPSEALVARERDAARGDRPWEEQQLGVDALTASGRTGAAEDVSTSHDVAEVRLGLFRTSDTRGAPSIRGFLGHATARAAFSGDKHLTATLRFPPRHDRRIPQAFPPLNFGDLDVEQQADALFSKVRLPSGLPSPRSPRTPRRTTLAPPHVASFSERANTSLRLSIDKKNTPLTPFSSTPRAPRSGRDANQGPMRTLSARTFETLLDESNVRENEVRSRPANEPRYARPPVSSFETNAPTWAPRNARGAAPSTHAAQPRCHTWHIPSRNAFSASFWNFFGAKKKRIVRAPPCASPRRRLDSFSRAALSDRARTRPR